MEVYVVTESSYSGIEVVGMEKVFVFELEASALAFRRRQEYPYHWQVWAAEVGAERPAREIEFPPGE